MTCTISVNVPVAASTKVSLKKLVPDTGDGKRPPVPVFTVRVVADALIPADNTVEALFADSSVKA
ncbi:TPA: hypothetical protein ACLMTC_004383, partial [Yersinia enterocolitica]